MHSMGLSLLLSEFSAMDPITLRYSFRPKTRSLATGHVADLFGLADQEPPHTVAEGVVLDARPGDLVLFTGPSGSGKSSLLREVGRRLGALDAAALTLPDSPLIDTLTGPVEERLEKLAACGLSEARLLLRTPAELSDGQRYRFRLAYALGQLESRPDRHRHQTVVTAEVHRHQTVESVEVHRHQTVGTVAVPFLLADEFAANLDRTLARVLAFNVRKLCSRTDIGFLLATTHDDLLDDLNPDLHVRCLGDGHVEVERRDVKKKRSASVTTYGCRRAPGPTGRT